MNYNNGISENICLKENDFPKKDIHSSSKYDNFKKRINFIMRYISKKNFSLSKTNDCRNRINLLCKKKK
jgi:hypothetical protein